jgi:hypothetical protein
MPKGNTAIEAYGAGDGNRTHVRDPSEQSPIEATESGDEIEVLVSA